MWRNLGFASFAVAVFTGTLSAGEGRSTRFSPPIRAVGESQAEGTLPPVEVRPPNRGQPEGETGQDEDTLPPVDAQPPATPSADPQPSQSPDASPSFPSLSDLVVGGFDGGTRGAPLSLFENPGALDVVTQQELAEQSPLDMGQALEQRPGVMMQRTGRGQSSPFIRGLTGNQVLILVDGIRMTNATFRAGPNQYFNTIDPNMVERIEVSRGPASVLYGGDAIGGVINVVTKKSNITGYDWLTGTTVQRFSSADLGYVGRLNVEGSVASSGVFAGAGYGNFNNLDIGGTPDAPPGFDPGRQPATSWQYRSADIKFNYALTESDELVVGWQRYVGKDVFRTDRFVQDRETIFDPQQRDLAFLRLQGTDSYGLVSSYQITGSFHRTKEGRRDSQPIGTFDAQREFSDDQTGVNAVFGTDLDAAGWLSYGVDWYHDEVDASVVNPDGGGDTAQFPDDAWYSRYGVFLQWDLPLTERLRATSGVRYEHVTSGATVTVDDASTKIDPEFQDWIGHGGLTYELAPWLHLVGSLSEGFRAPNLDDLAAINSNVFVGTQLPNPDLAPETSITYEVGTKVDARKLRTQAFVWWTDLEDHILRGPPDSQELLERTNKD
ncbi:MAG: TonB-dependent receptor domain-containing protein, partial [Planctomycetota bacterium]